MNIHIQNLRFSYPKFSLFVPLLTLQEAQVTTIVGPNGAGKTTLLKCLTGILPVQSNTVSINGQDLASLKGSRRARLIGYVPQELSSIFNYSVLDFVLTGRAAYLTPFSLPAEKDERICLEALNYVGIHHYARRPLFELSSGERRLVLIARALAQQAQVLYFDEPTTFLDPKHEIEVLELICKLSQEKQRTIVLTLHNLEMALEHSDYLIFMKEGKILDSGPPDEILSEALLEKAYGITMKIVEFNGKKFIIRGKSIS